MNSCGKKKTPVSGNTARGASSPAQRDPRVLRVACSVALSVGLLIAGVGTGVATMASPAAASTQSQQLLGRSYETRAAGQIITGQDVRLKLTKFQAEYAGKKFEQVRPCPDPQSNSIPSSVSNGRTENFCYQVESAFTGSQAIPDTGFFFYYDIEVPGNTGGWRSSGYYVDGATLVPFVGHNVIECSIKKSGGTKPVSGSPFRCETSWGNPGQNFDPQPHWKVTSNPVHVFDAKADPQRAAQLLEESCGDNVANTPQCSFDRTKTSVAFVPSDAKDWTPLTSWDNSCPPSVDPNHLTTVHYTQSTSISWSDTFGVKAGVKLKAPGGIVEGSVEASYQHSVAQKVTYEEAHSWTIPFKLRGALYLAHGFLEVTGDFNIIHRSDLYIIKDASFQFPLSKDVQMGGRGQTVRKAVVEHVTVPCDQKPPANGAAPPADAKAVPTTP